MCCVSYELLRGGTPFSFLTLVVAIQSVLSEIFERIIVRVQPLWKTGQGQSYHNLDLWMKMLLTGDTTPASLHLLLPIIMLEQ